MADSIQQLKDQITTKERELGSVGNKLSGAGIGATLTKNPLVGAAAGAYLGHEKEAKKQLEREIDDLKNKIKENERQISQLEQKQSQLRNDAGSERANLKAATQQKRNDLTRQRQNEQDPSRQRELDTQIARLQSDEDAKERENSRSLDMKLADLQDQIHRLS